MSHKYLFYIHNKQIEAIPPFPEIFTQFVAVSLLKQRYDEITMGPVFF